MSDGRLQQSCQVGACGWEHPGWSGAFYPEDLPPEWRLGYYANEFPVVLVPTDSWLGASAAELEAWRSDVASSFAFYLELDRLLPAERYLPRLRQAADLLVGQMRGVVYRGPISACPSLPEELGVTLYQDLLDPELINAGPVRSLQLLVGTVATDRVPELIQLRRQIEQMAQRSAGDMVCFFRGTPPNIEIMRQTVQLLELMGYA